MASGKQRQQLNEVASSNEQESNTYNLLLMPQPLSVAVDADLMNKIVSSFQNQLTEVMNRMTALQNEQDHQHALAAPVIGPENVKDTSVRKRGRKYTTSLVGEIYFAFEPPKFCVEENIDLDKVLICRFRDAIEGKLVSKLSTTERLQNWKVEKRARHSAKVQDLYYYHLPSQLKLRSRTLVYQFLLDGTYRPNHIQGTKKAKKLVEDASVDNKRSSSGSSESNRRSKRLSQKTICDVNYCKMKKNKIMAVDDAEKKMVTRQIANKKNNYGIDNKVMIEKKVNKKNKIIVADDAEIKMEYEQEEHGKNMVVDATENKIVSEEIVSNVVCEDEKENKMVVDDMEIKKMIGEMLNKMKVEDLDEERENKMFNVEMEIKMLDYETENKMINNEVELNKMMNNVDLEMKMIEEEIQNKIMQYVVEMMDKELQNNMIIEELMNDQSEN
ncbi:hypothetical protein VNO77_19567 [Canavalia gladiata]|uniref:Uncharacterized protein n=1 Tax=Canavalia gladiata TaxID=3824 RepID=A0AAN9LSU1_CANGL